MADTKVTALTELTTPAGVDLLYIVNDPSGTPLSRKCTVANLFANASPITIASGTLTASTPALNITQTWNNAGVTFTCAKINVTDTASNAASLLLDLQVGGTSRFNVDKNSNTTWAGSPVLKSGAAIFIDSTVYFASSTAAGSRATAGSGFNVGSGFSYGFSSTTGANGAADVLLSRDAANTLALRNGANAQTFNIYNFTDASNYERGFIRYSSNILQIGHEGAGTGSNSRTLAFRTAGFNPLTLDTSEAIFNVLGTFTGGLRITATGASAFISFVESTGVAAPAANGVRIYAEDNGSGKTRLMALFNTGAAQQIAIEP